MSYLRLRRDAVSVALLCCLTVSVETAESARERDVAPTAPAVAELEQLQRRVSALLMSDSARDQAWGAYYVAQHRLDSSAPEVVALLGKKLGIDQPSDEDGKVISACVDGLIQTNHPVDKAMLDLLWSKPYRKVSAVCLSSNHKKDGALFLAEKLTSELGSGDEIRDSYSEAILFIALCNSLAQSEKKVFAETVLPRMRPQLEVHIALPPDQTNQTPTDTSTQGASGEFTMTYTSGRPAPDKSWPPSVDYTLSLSPFRWNNLLAQGPKSVYWQREINKNGSSSQKIPAFSRREYCRDCLAWPRNEQDLPQIKAYLSVSWSDKEPFLAALKTAAVNARTPWLSLFDRLIKEKVIPADANAEELFQVDISYRGHLETVPITLPTLLAKGALHESKSK